MKHVYLIGDSIRIGYDSVVREELAGQAQVYWHHDNARFVQYTLRYLPEWAREDCDPEQIDIVHWNNGLWDVLHVLGDECQTDADAYRRGLERLIRRIRQVFPKAKIFFGLSTCVVEAYMTDPDYKRFNADIRQYNAIAEEVMHQEGILVDDLYTCSEAMPLECRTPEGTHFTSEGYQMLGKQVAAFLRPWLE